MAMDSNTLIPELTIATPVIKPLGPALVARSVVRRAETQGVAGVCFAKTSSVFVCVVGLKALAGGECEAM